MGSVPWHSIQAVCPEYTAILKAPSPSSGLATTLHGHHAPQTSWCPADECELLARIRFVRSPWPASPVFPVLGSCRVCFLQCSHPATACFSLSRSLPGAHFLQWSALAMAQLSLALGARRVMAFSCTGLLQGRLPPAVSLGAWRADFLQVPLMRHLGTPHHPESRGFALPKGDSISALEKRALLRVPISPLRIRVAPYICSSWFLSILFNSY